jgi:hypothetical protein
MGGYATKLEQVNYLMEEAIVLEIAARAGFDRLFVFGHAR